MTDRVQHPALGVILCLGDWKVPKKVWKHFYDPLEAWERLAVADVAAMRVLSESVAGVRRNEHVELPDVESTRAECFLDLVRQHHEEHYALVYFAAILSSATRWAPHRSEANQQVGRSTNGIYLSLGRGNPSWVITAYRPVPFASNVTPSETEFQRSAHRIFNSLAARRDQMEVDPTLEWLRSHAGELPRSPAALWSLAHAIGCARHAPDGAVEGAILAEADATLNRVPRSEIRQLSEGLEWSAALDSLSVAVGDEEPDELELALLSVEELLIVADVLGVHAAAERFLSDAEMIVAWTPPEWGRIADLADAQLQGVESHALPARLWTLARDSVVGGLIRQSLTAPRPQTTLTDALLASHPVEVSLRSRLASMIARSLGTATEFIDAFACQRKPAFLGKKAIAAHSIVAQKPPVGRHIRVFAAAEGVDAVPEEVTADIIGAKAPAEFWELNVPGEAVTIVVFESAQPISGESFDDVVEAARGDVGVAVSLRTFSRPN